MLFVHWRMPTTWNSSRKVSCRGCLPFWRANIPTAMTCWQKNIGRSAASCLPPTSSPIQYGPHGASAGASYSTWALCSCLSAVWAIWEPLPKRVLTPLLQPVRLSARLPRNTGMRTISPFLICKTLRSMCRTPTMFCNSRRSTV